MLRPYTNSLKIKCIVSRKDDSEILSNCFKNNYVIRNYKATQNIVPYNVAMSKGKAVLGVEPYLYSQIDFDELTVSEFAEQVTEARELDILENEK